MNVSHPFSSLPVPPDATAKTPKIKASRTSSPIKKRARRDKNQTKFVPADATQQEYQDCLHQAEICHAQAQEAARLKRFKAARGLFATAIALCQRALGLREKKATVEIAPVATAEVFDESAAQEAQQVRAYLHELTIEMTTYSELARSLERPLRPNAPR